MKNISAIKILEEKSIQITVAKYPNIPSYAVPKPKYTDKTSNGLTKCVIHWIEFNDFQAERINSTGRQIDNTKTVTDVIGRRRTIGSKKWIKGTGQTGTADISATILGRSVKIEIKCKATGDNVQSTDQKKYQAKIEKSGGIYLLVRTFEQFYQWYLKFIKDQYEK